MTNPAFNPDDPRLTAFVLGEIEDTDRAEIEQLLEFSPEAQATVKELEETIGLLKEGLAMEPAPVLTAEQRAAVEEEAQSPAPKDAPVAAASSVYDGNPGLIARFGKLGGVVASVAALGLAVAFLGPQTQEAREAASMAFNEEVADSESDELLALADSEKRMNFSDRQDLGSGVEMEEFTAVARPETSTEAEFGTPTGMAARGVSAPGNSIAGGAYSTEGSSSLTRSPRPRGQALPAETASSDSPDVSLSLTSPIEESAPQSNPGDQPRGGFRMVKGGQQIASAGNGTAGTVATTPSRDDSSDVGLAKSVAGRGVAGGGASGSSGKLAAPATLRPAPAQASDGGESSGRSNSNASPALNDSVAQRSQAGSQRAGGRDSSGNKDSRIAAAAIEAPRVSPEPAPADPFGNSSDGASPVPTSASSRKGDRKVAGSSVPLNRELQKYLESDPAYAKRPASKSKPASGEESSNTGAYLSDAAESGSSSGRSPSSIKKSDAALVGKATQGQPVSVTADLEGRLVAKADPTDVEQQARAAAAIKAAELDKKIKEKTGGGFKQIQHPQQVERLLKERLVERYYDPGKAHQWAHRYPEPGSNNEAYDQIVENRFVVPERGNEEKCLSTISVDVDTASYANVRRFLNGDLRLPAQLPPPDAVRIEELINYFKYSYPEPEGKDPFSVTTEIAQCPWQPGHRLAMVGLKAKTIEKTQRPPTNLIFLLDVSGSMRASNKLPLVQQAMRMLVDEMTEDDRIAVVTYASNAGIRLESTPGSKKDEILNVINGLRAGGSTNGAGGIQMAYDVANRHYVQGGANRVILCTDGDFNVGISDDNALVELIQEKAASGVFLSVFGYGMGNLKDAKLEKLADKGNGHYGYIDNQEEARKVFQEELVGTLYTVAKDVKLQVEFNPATVGAYRLIGYENRKLAAQDFTDDTKDAGEIGSGHTVTALYEVIPKHFLLTQPEIDGLKYQSTEEKPKPADGDQEPQDVDEYSSELLTVKLRYKLPDEETSQPVSNDFPVQDIEIPGKQSSAISDDLMFAASVASFGMNLRHSPHRGDWGFVDVLEAAQRALGENDVERRKEFVGLVQRAMTISSGRVGPQPTTNQRPVGRPGELSPADARVKAAVDGKYRRLVKKIEVRDDFQRFGGFNDYGYWEGTEYAGRKDLLPGFWVYVYPNWYIWAETTQKDAPAEK